METAVAAASIKDVARVAGVSVGTVSNVLNHPDKVAAATVARVQEAIERLGFVRNDVARQLRDGRSKSVGLIVLDVRNPFFTDIARGAEDEAARHGLSLLLGNSDEDSTREATYLDLFEEQHVHGVLISPYGDIDRRLRRLRSRGTPAVLVDRRGDDDSFSSVSVDDVAGGRMAVQHLLDGGRTRIAFVGGPFEIRQVHDRHAGAREAIGAAPGTAALEVLPTAALTVLEGRRVGMMLLERDEADRPDALFAANDLVAMGLLQALSMNGEALVPEQIAIIGFDDIDFAAAAVVPLSSVRQPAQLIGATALQILVEEAAAELPPRHIEFQPQLVERESSQPRR